MKPDQLGLDVDSFPTPKHWTRRVKQVFLNSVALLFDAHLTAVALAEEAENPRMQLVARIERLEAQLRLRDRQLELLRYRFARLPAAKRPHFTGVERLQVLALITANGWSYSTAAAEFLLSKGTLYLWNRIVREGGEDALVQLSEEPINKYAEAQAEAVRNLAALLPHEGLRTIASQLLRAGWHVSKSTAHRMLGEKPGTRKKKTDKPQDEVTLQEEPAAQEKPVEEARHIRSDRPNHIWNADLTTVPTLGGLRLPDWPFAKLQCWPYCWWVMVVVDHYSRKIIATCAFKHQPSSEEVCDVLEAAIRHHGTRPRHIITDKGGQFWTKKGRPFYQDWCDIMNVRPRFGAIGKHGSIAITERTIRSIKGYLRRTLVPLNQITMQTELNILMDYFNQHRPHTHLGYQTPDEVYFNQNPQCMNPRFEPRHGYPAEGFCAAPQVPVRGSPGAKIEIEVTYFHGRHHLPLVSIKDAA